MKIEDMTEEKRFAVSDLIADGMSKEEAIAKVTGEEFTAEVEVIDTRQYNAIAEDVSDEGPSIEELRDAQKEADMMLAEEIERAAKIYTSKSEPQSLMSGIKGMGTQLCECGKIKIGKKGAAKTSQRGNSFRPPQKLDHFLVTTTGKTEDDDFEEDAEIMGILGDNCKAIPVVLLYDEPTLNFMTSLAYYDSAKCQCRGNGEVAIKSDGTQIECDPETCKFAKDKKCKPNGILSVVLQDAPRVGGVWKFRTTGWNSIRNLMSSIEFIHGLTGGRLAGLPLMLTLQPKSTIIPGTKTKTTIYLVNLEFRGTMGELIERATTRLNSPEQIARIEAKATEMLATPESSDECQDVQDEFYPETMKEMV